MEIHRVEGALSDKAAFFISNWGIIIILTVLIVSLILGTIAIRKAKKKYAAFVALLVSFVWISIVTGIFTLTNLIIEESQEAFKKNVDNNELNAAVKNYFQESNIDYENFKENNCDNNDSSNHSFLCGGGKYVENIQVMKNDGVYVTIIPRLKISEHNDLIVTIDQN